MLAVGTVSASDKKLYATFGVFGSGANASYDASTYTYTWTGSTNNVMPCFTFSNGELANYTTLNFTFSSLSGGSVRINLLFSDGKNVNTNNGYYSNGTKDIDLTGLTSSSLTVDGVSHSLADVTAIRFAGNSIGDSHTQETVVVKASEMYLSKSETVGTPGGNAAYGDGLYTWTATSDNLMSCFEFSSGELTNYKTLHFTLSNLTGSSMVRMGYYVGTTFTEFGTGFGNNGDKTVDLTALGIDLSTVTKISFGGRTMGGEESNKHSRECVRISNVYLEPSSSGNNLTATFGTPGGNAKFIASNGYGWMQTSNNLMNVLTFSSGELAKYTTLKFTIGDLTGGMVRMGYYVGSTFTEFGTGFGSNGVKTVNLLDLKTDLSTVTSIAFGGRTETGYCTIDPSSIVLSNEALGEAVDRSFTKDRKSTVCLPFDLTTAEASAAGKFYTLNSVDGTTLKFTDVGDPAAYTPYVFVPAKDGRLFYNFGKTLESSANVTCETSAGSYTFHGVLKSETVPEGAYGYNASDGVFSKTTSANVNINAFRAYITGPADSGEGSVKSLTAVFNDDATTTAIQQMQSAAVSKAMYNLAGQRVGSGYKGIAIVNGKKVLMK